MRDLLPILNYILDEQGNVVPEPDFIKWGKFFQQLEKRVVGKNTYPFKDATIEVSTVFLGMPHCYPFHQHKDGNDAFFETMVFADDEILAKIIDMSESDTSSVLAAFCDQSDIQVRYATRDEAIKGHQQMCEFVEVCLAKLAMEEHDA